MTRSEKIQALRADLYSTATEMPLSGALNKGGKPYRPTRFLKKLQATDHDDDELLAYVVKKMSESETDGYSALLDVDRLDLSMEWQVADTSKVYADLPELIEIRPLAETRLAGQQEELARRAQAAEAEAVEEDREIVAQVAAMRREKGLPWTTEIEAGLMARRAAARAPGGKP